MNVMQKIKSRLFSKKGSEHPYSHMVTSVTEDQFFQENWERGMTLTKIKKSSWRKDRFYNLVAALRATEGVLGDIVECGCFTGLSSYLLCSEIRRESPAFAGEKYHIYDSFEGLSEPNSAEAVVLEQILQTKTAKGMFTASETLVRNNLSEFPKISYHPGFIPQTLDASDSRKYRFVHLDMDLVEPTIEACKHFYPRLSPGGMIVCDDYGSHLWKETKKELDRFCRERKIPMIGLSTGQAVLLTKFN